MKYGNNIRLVSNRIYRSGQTGILIAYGNNIAASGNVIIFHVIFPYFAPVCLVGINTEFFWRLNGIISNLCFPARRDTDD